MTNLRGILCRRDMTDHILIRKNKEIYDENTKSVFRILRLNLLQLIFFCIPLSLNSILYAQQANRCVRSCMCFLYSLYLLRLFAISQPGWCKSKVTQRQTNTYPFHIYEKVLCLDRDFGSLLPHREKLRRIILIELSCSK